MDSGMLQRQAVRGEPDDEFPVESTVVLPGTHIWKQQKEGAQGVMLDFMSNSELLSQDEIFPFLVVSTSPHVVPPAPDDRVFTNL